MEEYDFSGWATRNNVRCSDGRTIKPGAFAHLDGETVPLVWNHQHNDPFNYLGHALLENRDDGVYAYCQFNSTESAQQAKELVLHGDITALSIFADKLKQTKDGAVMHGQIREVSLVLAGANPGAFIQDVIQHGDDEDGAAEIYSGERISLHLAHTEETEAVEEKEEPVEVNSEKEIVSTEEVIQHAEETDSKVTVADVIDTMNEEQKNVLYYLVGQAMEEDGSDDDETEGDEEEVKHNVFDSNSIEDTKNTLSHSDAQAIFADAKRYGSLRDSALAHGIEQIDYLFPEATLLDNPPSFIQRDMGWVQQVMGAVRRTPFSRIKSMFADITEDDARAKGYIKGKLKKEEVFGLLKRTTTPTTIYKKQKLDRDDVIDITDFDVVAWLKTEMRMMLDEELARAFLVGDGRLASSDDKINEQNIRPVWTDEDLYTVKIAVPTGTTDAATAKNFIRSVIKSRKQYKGSGNPTLYTTEDLLTEMLLLEDNTGRIIYESADKLKTALRVQNIVTVPVMEGLTRTDKDGATRALLGLLVNLSDYNVGADKGGAVNMFDDFDIDYNAQKYLIETRCSGALIKPFSAIALETVASTTPNPDNEQGN